LIVPLAILFGTILLDVSGQICFKIGLSQGPDQLPLWRKVMTGPAIWVGVALYAIEFGAWLFVLSRLDLSIAFPLASLSYCGVAIASRVILGEPVSSRRWTGTILIAAGAAIVSASA
jgi:drug/metabolite transporter (DMT)-like permease